MHPLYCKPADRKLPRPAHALCLALPGAMLLAAQPASAQDDGAEGAEHETLFVIEEAFTQDKGEWQIGLALAQSLDEGSAREWEAEIEFGLTDRLQIETEVELEQEDGEIEFGDLAIGLSYALIDGGGIGRPEITLGAGVIVPTGGSDGESSGLGFAASLRASQQLTQALFAHAGIGYSEAPARDFANFRLQQSEWAAGAALAYAIAPDWFVSAEYELARASEDTGSGRNSATSHTAALGMTREIADDLMIGAAATLVATRGDDEAQLRAIMQFEF